MGTRKVVVAAILGLSLLVGWGGAQVGASTYLGEVCLFGTQTEDEAGPIAPTGTQLVFRLGVSQADASHFFFQGTRSVTPPLSPSSLPVFIEGAVLLHGSDVIISGHSTYDGNPNYTTRSGRAFQLRVGAVDLSGTFWSTWHEFDTGARTFTARYAAGTVALGTCP
jgi:hypothetical protein